MNVTTQDAARSARIGAIIAALVLILAYVAGALLHPVEARGWLVYTAIAVLLLSAPLRGLVNDQTERRARGAFWCAMLSMVFACHGVVMAVSTETRSLGVVVLASALVMFFTSNLQLRVGGRKRSLDIH